MYFKSNHYRLAVCTWKLLTVGIGHLRLSYVFSYLDGEKWVDELYIYYCNSDCYRLGVWELLIFGIRDFRLLYVFRWREVSWSSVYILTVVVTGWKCENFCLLVLENVVQLWLSQQIRVSRWTVYVTGSGKTGVSPMSADLIFDHETRLLNLTPRL